MDEPLIEEIRACVNRYMSKHQALAIIEVFAMRLEREAQACLADIQEDDVTGNRLMSVAATVLMTEAEAWRGGERREDQ